MVYARFCWVSFKAPQLNVGEQQQLAQSVRAFGKGAYVREFVGLGSTTRPFSWSRFVEIHWSGLVYITFVIVGIVTVVLYPDVKAQDTPWWLQAILTVFVISCFAAPIFYVSMIVAALEYRSWLESVLRGGANVPEGRFANGTRRLDEFFSLRNLIIILAVLTAVISVLLLIHVR